METVKRKLVFSSGEVFLGDGFGAKTDAIGEVVFNTSMAGYQEVVSDLSYTDQIIVMSYPIIGSYGITDEDYESKSLGLRALVVREYNDCPSNFRYTKTLCELLEENGIPGLQNVDTRRLVRLIRDKGAMVAVLVDADFPDEKAIKMAKDYVDPCDQVKRAGCKKRWYSRTPNHKYNVVAIDCGIKFNMIKALNDKGCNVTVVPHDITADEVMNLRPDGVFLSNGPGDPVNVPEVIDLVRELRGRIPMMGVCLGHQLICLAEGAKTFKLKFGHRGGNHPIFDKTRDEIEITAQNHSYAVDANSLEGTGLEITHVNLLDGTVEGVESKEDSIFSVQFHPESAPGPNDSIRLFDKFILNIEEWKKNHAEEN